MKRSTKYVALDVHQPTTVASVREQAGRVRSHRTMKLRGLRLHYNMMHANTPGRTSPATRS